MPNQNPNGRNMNRDERPSWRNQDMMDDDRYFDRNDRDRDRGDRERMMRGGNESRLGSRRDWSDDDEGYRSTERYGGGQSGYGAGRFGDDRSMGPGYRNQSSWNRGHDDRQGMHTDERWQGRGGPQYWDERSDRGDRGYRGQGMDDRTERTGYHSGYNRGEGFGGYGQQGIQQNVGSQTGFRGGRQFADEYNQNRGRDYEQGMGYGQGHGFGLGQGMGHQGERQGGMMGSQGYYGQGGVGGGYGGSGMQGGNVGQGISHRGKGPQNWQRSDERIKEQVCEALSDDDHIDASNIEIQVKNGEVILTGTVEDRRTKRLAEDLIERMPGVKDVQNQLRVGSDKRGNQNMGSAVGKNETETSSTDRKHRA